MNRKFYWTLLVLAVAFFSCSKEEDVAFTDTPIVEAYLYANDTIGVSVYRQIPFSENAVFTEVDPNDLNISISIDGLTQTLLSAGDGIYTSSSVMNEGQEISFQFTWNGTSVSGYTYIPSKPQDFTCSATSMEIERMDSASGPPSGTMPDPLEITWSNSDASYYLVVIENIESSLDPIRDFGDEEAPGPRFRKSPITASGQQINAMEFQYYGTHRVILFHVLPDYASLYDESGNSSLNLTNPSSSISNAYGIFTGINSDTLYIEIEEP